MEAKSKEGLERRILGTSILALSSGWEPYPWGFLRAGLSLWRDE